MDLKQLEQVLYDYMEIIPKAIKVIKVKELNEKQKEYLRWGK